MKTTPPGISRHTDTKKKMISCRKDSIQHPGQPLLQYCAPSQEQSNFVFHSARFDRPFIDIKIRNNVIDKNKRKGAMEPSPNAKRFFSFKKKIAQTQRKIVKWLALQPAPHSRLDIHLAVTTGETLDVLCLMITQPDYNK